MSIRRSKVVDVSSFLLFEATGDSESVCNFDAAMADINGGEDDDDAESCSSDTVLPGVRHTGSLENKFAYIGGDIDDEDDEDDDGVVEQREVQLYKKCCRDDQRINGVFVAKEKKPSSAVPIDNSNETMDEMGKNRLFWEACLAS
ncbi:RNA-binding protein-defense related 1 isoform 1 [Hibiscus syriacus]|uniref:RNA-binding protein-defense related 1 isoform 1 n=1 Tax=Hibiscus syriacus TaxID=106335 RepID=A0A6A2XKX7_HIBSY|nr:uncharacterized protein LOC120165724 [Hibiscus syriacus]KAE8676463.1 RNA-binding protein-defense related 1 isoform 1 [Hibiscus syriacus]